MDQIRPNPNGGIQGAGDEIRMDVDNDHVQLDNELQQPRIIPNAEAMALDEQRRDELPNAAEMPMTLDVDEPANNNANHPPANNSAPTEDNPAPNASAAPIPNKRPKPPRCRTTKLVLTFGWDWDKNAAACGICRNPLVLRCNDCEVHFRDKETCTEAQGSCNHVFHQHCIARWLETQTTCPIDSTRWVYIR